MQEILAKALVKAAKNGGFSVESASLDFTETSEHGDLTSNLALANSKKWAVSPRSAAEKILSEFQKIKPDFVEKSEIAGPGFMNFYLKPKNVAEEVVRISEDPDFGKTDIDSGKQIMIEYTDPNTFKPFHIGHLMANAVGESLSRLIENSGAKVTRLCYPSDIGLHIAKSIWALKKHLSEMPSEKAPIDKRTEFLGKMYVEGTNAYDSDPAAKKEVDELNGIIYEKSDKEINKLYDTGRKWSLDHFEALYKILGTRFDDYIYESEAAPLGTEIVKKHVDDIFEKSDGAVVFKGEEFGLHTRVFLNAKGIPTYEAKDLGLNTLKFKKYPKTDESIIVTANEQDDYFKVIIKVLGLLDKEIGSKTRHISHGMLRFASGKMSSRTGNVVTAEALLKDMKALVAEKIADRKFNEEEKESLADMIAVAAIKFTILRSSIGGNIVFDSAASISFEGDSGPYLQYSAVRASSVLEKSKELSKNKKIILPDKVGQLERLILRFPIMAKRARQESAPQLVANYLISLAAAFNSFYAVQVIVSEGDPYSPYYIALTKAFRQIMQRGLDLLGIKIPPKM